MPEVVRARRVVLNSSTEIESWLCVSAMRLGSDISRRFVAAAFAPLLALPPLAPLACAFPNEKGPVVPKIKNPGPKPTDIGLKPDGQLRPCLDGKPHCFSSSTVVGEYKANINQVGSGWIVQPWRFKSITVAGAFSDLKEVLAAYPPGQNGIDKGGFAIISQKFPESADDSAYLYAQFESSVGYIDDMEFALLNGVVNVRTSSRLGFLDFGVNAKRYNYFATKLGGKKGWTTNLVRAQDHLDYFGQNDVTDADVGA